MIALLQREGVACLGDVRTQPYSRFQPEFSREALAVRIEAAGVRYIFLGHQLGGRPSEPACYVDGRVDYRACRDLPDFRTGVERVISASRQGLVLCLLCSESRPEECHRTRLIGRVLAESGIEVRHIDERGVLRSQPEVEARLTGGQASLFDDSSLLDWSRLLAPRHRGPRR